MANVSKRRHNRRRLAALTFLSNISLDGTHRDTTLGILNLNVQGSKSERSRLVKDATETSVRINRHLLNRRSTISECVDSRESEKSNRWSDTEEKHGSFCQYDYERHHSKNKDRVHKFVSDTKARLTNLSQKRKLIHQKSNLESHGLYSFTSTESLACTSRSRKASVSPSESSYSSVSEFRILKSVRDQHVYSGRVVLITSKKVPFVIFSTLPYLRHSTHGNVRSDVKPEGNRRRHTSSMRQLSIINDGPDPFELVALLGIEKPQEGQGISFSHLLAPTHLPRRCRSYAPELDHPPTVTHNLHPSGCMSFDQAIVVRTHCSFPSTALPNVPDKVSLERENPSVNCHHPCHASYPVYNPNLLDDPELIAGKHSTLLAFPSYITSVIDYVKPSDLKKDLNDKFRERFPHVHLTLSKLRSLKREMVKITKHECSIDLLIVAQAYVYFEKLILKMLVNKQNRKLCAGACLLLSAKLNDVKGMDLRNLLEKIEVIFRVSRKDLVCLELGVLVALEFSLHLPTWEILPHYQRLIYES